MAEESTPTSSREDVANAIRQAILAGDLAPGQRLVEAELCASLNASRGAVRTALMDLAHEDLVERVANRGARVRVVSVDEALHITEVRMALEILCAGKAAAKITDQQIAELREIGEHMAEAVETGDSVTYSDFNQQLHREVVRIADQPVAEEILDRLRARNVRHQFRLAYRPGRPQEALPLRLAVIDAISNRDVAAAEDATRTYMGNVLREFEKFRDAPAGALRPLR